MIGRKLFTWARLLAMANFDRYHAVLPGGSSLFLRWMDESQGERNDQG